MLYPALFTTAFVALLLWAEWRENRRARAVFKLTASTSFVGIAVAAGALDSTQGRWVLLGLALSWLGDAFLLGQRRSLFLAGLVGFLLAHVAYIAMFLTVGVKATAVMLAALPLTVGAAAVAGWLVPRLERRMRLPVLAYLVVISTMVAAAAGAFAAAGAPLLLCAALAFCVSDLSVARDRFVAPSFVNRLWGLPLYYAAQVLFASSPRWL